VVGPHFLGLLQLGQFVIGPAHDLTGRQDPPGFGDGQVGLAHVHSGAARNRRYVGVVIDDQVDIVSPAQLL
jgi:hypothetical protein